jgi:hypothetical protein
VGRWRGAITAVALEEMLHLALVSNLLTAVGAAPHMRRPPFPQVSRYYPAGITIELRRFSDATLTRFVHLERPEGVDIEEEVLADPAIDLDGDAPDVAPGALRTPEDVVEEVPRRGLRHRRPPVPGDRGRHRAPRGAARRGRRLHRPPEAQATSAYFRFPTSWR